MGAGVSLILLTERQNFIRVCRDLKMKVSLAGRRRGGMNRPWKVNDHSKVKLFHNWRSLRLPWNTLVIKTDRTTHFSLCIYIHGLKTACHLIWKSPPRPLKFRFTTCKKTCLKASGKQLRHSRNYGPMWPPLRRHCLKSGSLRALFEESKTTQMLVNHRWSAVVTRFHHI